MRSPAILSTLVLSLLVSATCAVPSRAQSRPPVPGPGPPHRVEIGAHSGYVWTDGREVSSQLGPGTLDLASGGFWGITLDLNVRPDAQAELLYNRQDTRFTFEPETLGAPEHDVVDVAVEYWQLGGLAGVERGRFFPFLSLTLGATRIDYKGIAEDDDWKFSLLLGGGAKAYLGRRLGARVQGRLPFTLVSGGGSFACGSGSGCLVTVGGTGVLQFDLSAGLFAMF